MGCEEIVWKSTKPVREDCHGIAPSRCAKIVLGGAPFMCEVIVCEGTLWGARQFLGGTIDVRVECVGEHL